MKKNKKGMELALNTIVILILAIMVLVFSLLFFTSAGQSLLGNLRGFTGYSNVDSVVQGCNVFSQTGSSYSFCCEKKSVKYILNGKEDKAELSCYELSLKNISNNKISVLDCSGVNC